MLSRAIDIRVRKRDYPVIAIIVVYVAIEFLVGKIVDFIKGE